MANYNTKTLIDAVLLRTENQSSTDAANSPRRTRILEWTQQVFDEVWNHRPWAWTHSSTTLTISGGSSSAALPSDFQEIGPEGGAWQSSGITNPFRLEEVSPQQIIELQQGSQSFAIHSKFAVFGVNDTIGTQLFQTAKCSGSINFNVNYKIQAPTLADLDSTSSNLQYIPASYHYSVLLPGVQALSARSKGHKQLQSDYFAAYSRGLSSMRAREDRRRSGVQRFGRPP